MLRYVPVLFCGRSSLAKQTVENECAFDEDGCDHDPEASDKAGNDVCQIVYAEVDPRQADKEYEEDR